MDGMPNDLQGMIQKAQEMQQKLRETQEKIKELEFEGTSGGGMVKITLGGDRHIINIEISDDVVNPDDKDMLYDMIKAAHTNAIEQVNQHIEDSMKEVTGGLSIPGLF